MFRLFGKKEETEPWDRVVMARTVGRFTSLDIIEKVFGSFYELHGDRNYGDDKSILAGIGMLGKFPVTIISQQRGRDFPERMERRNGMVMPEGYRKALRLMKQAEKFSRPIICFIDTPGAFAGVDAEKRGQAEAIASNLFEMSKFTVPIISVVLSEGGSGGALALGVANEIYMMENAVFSVISPEGCASILWKDTSLASKAAKDLKITAKDLQELNIIDKIIPETDSFDKMCKNIKSNLCAGIQRMVRLSADEIREQRRDKFRNIGAIAE